MSLRHYDIGDEALLTGVFTDAEDGAAVDPDTVTVTVTRPDGTTLTPSVVPGDPGEFTATIALDQAGDWWYAFDGEGGYRASGEKRLRVRRQRVTR